MQEAAYLYVFLQFDGHKANFFGQFFGASFSDSWYRENLFVSVDFQSVDYWPVDPELYKLM